MTDLSQQQHDLDPNNQLSYDDGGANDNDAAGRPSKKRNIQDAGDDDDDDEKGGRERRKIDIKFIQDKSRRHITFSKRKAGIMKKVS
jgi:pheromone receptor transcription factor